MAKIKKVLKPFKTVTKPSFRKKKKKMAEQLTQIQEPPKLAAEKEVQEKLGPNIWFLLKANPKHPELRGLIVSRLSMWPDKTPAWVPEDIQDILTYVREKLYKEMPKIDMKSVGVCPMCGRLNIKLTERGKTVITRVRGSCGCWFEENTWKPTIPIPKTKFKFEARFSQTVSGQARYVRTDQKNHKKELIIEELNILWDEVQHNKTAFQEKIQQIFQEIDEDLYSIYNEGETSYDDDSADVQNPEDWEFPNIETQIDSFLNEIGYEAIVVEDAVPF